MRADEVLGRTDEEFYDDPAQGRQMMANDRRVMESGLAVTVEEVVLLGCVWRHPNRKPHWPAPQRTSRKRLPGPAALDSEGKLRSRRTQFQNKLYTGRKII